jgi:hypothetical protein
MTLFFQSFGVGLATYVLFAFLGWLPWALLGAHRGPLPFVVAAPLFGLAVLEGFGWYWLEYADAGIGTGLPVLLGVVAILSAIAVKSRGRVTTQRIDTRRALSAILLAAVVFGGLMFHFGRALEGGDLTAATLGNNDVAAYSLMSENIRDTGFDAPGPIVGNDLGNVARVDATGARIVLTAAAEITGLDVYEATIPVVGFGAFLVALACALLAERIVPGSTLRSAAIGLVAVASYLFVYSTAHYFLAQVLTIAPAVVLLVLYSDVAQQRGRVSLIRSTAAAALLLVPVLLTYPHMAVLLQPVVLAIAWLADGFRNLARRAKRLAGCAAGGIGAAVILVLPAVGDAVDRARQLARVEAGWPLGLFSPFQSVGLQRFPDMVDITRPGPTTTRYFAEFAVVAAIAVATTLVLVRSGSPRPWLGGLVVLGVLVSYRFVYEQQGYSYRQWKWISFFQPMLSTALAALACGAAVTLFSKSRIPQAALRVGGGIAIVVWLGVLTSCARTLTNRPWTVVGPDLTGLEEVRASNLRVVNVDVAPYWESMWAAYFVAPAETRIVQESYYARSAETARWTIRRTDRAAPTPESTPVLRTIDLNETYELTCSRQPCSLPDP